MLVGEITDDEKKKADEEIREQQKQIDYDTKDYTIELLVQKFEKNDFFIPDYQRALMWGNANKNLFIESVLLGLPIQGLKKLKHVNGFKFDDLSEMQRRKFLNRTLRIVVLGENTPVSSRQELFYRINTAYA